MRASLNVHAPHEASFADVSHLGFVIRKVAPQAHHIGLLYQVDDEEPMVFHLAWHRRLQHDRPTVEYAWGESGLDDLNREAIASALSEMTPDNRDRIPYSPIYTGLYFQGSDLLYVRDDPSDGLTCATFIMAIFEFFGITLLNRKSWELQPHDEEWFNHVVELLDQNPAGDIGIDAHIAAIKAKGPGVRFKPGEVAAGMSSPSPPIDYADAQTIASYIMALCAS